MADCEFCGLEPASRTFVSVEDNLMRACHLCEGSFTEWENAAEQQGRWDAF